MVFIWLCLWIIFALKFSHRIDFSSPWAVDEQHTFMLGGSHSALLWISELTQDGNKCQKCISSFIFSSQVIREDSLTGVKNSNIQDAAARYWTVLEETCDLVTQVQHWVLYSSVWSFSGLVIIAFLPCDSVAWPGECEVSLKWKPASSTVAKFCYIQGNPDTLYSPIL